MGRGLAWPARGGSSSQHSSPGLGAPPCALTDGSTAPGTRRGLARREAVPSPSAGLSAISLYLQGNDAPGHRRTRLWAAGHVRSEAHPHVCPQGHRTHFSQTQQVFPALNTSLITLIDGQQIDQGGQGHSNPPILFAPLMPHPGFLHHEVEGVPRKNHRMSSPTGLERIEKFCLNEVLQKVNHPTPNKVGISSAAFLKDGCELLLFFSFVF